jgi:neuromedin U receptor 1
MFFLCWLPFHVQRLLSIYLNEMAEADAATAAAEPAEYPSSAVFTLFSVVFYISGYCYYSNSACNPILYNTLSAKYRMAFCRTVGWSGMA